MYAKRDFKISAFNKAWLISELLEWVENGYLKSMNKKETLTPYVHTFLFHMPEFLDVYRDVSKYSCQSLESLNKSTKRDFFLQTNKKTNEFLTQLMETATRKEFIHLNGTVAELYEKTNR
jgi:hypothetical protein